ncbi:MAG: exodeoxyribonuclease VII small subunit [Verrucomicrobiota bacterium]
MLSLACIESISGYFILTVKPVKETKSLKFEEAIEQLESTVEQMENDQLPLDQLILRYEEGMKLVAFCQEKLSEAEQKVEVLTQAQKSEPKPKKSDQELELQ